VNDDDADEKGIGEEDEGEEEEDCLWYDLDKTRERNSRSMALASSPSGPI
jgi:hypothetical protein